MKALYKYPIAEYPYSDLVHRNWHATKKDPEYEILDTKLFHRGCYFDVFAEYAKETENNIVIRITVHNRDSSNESADLWLLPNLWFRNSWSWGVNSDNATNKPCLRKEGNIIKITQDTLEDDFQFEYEKEPEKWLFTDNETNYTKFGWEPPEGASSFTKDAFHRYVIHGESKAVNEEHFGTKAAPLYKVKIPSGDKHIFKFRLARKSEGTHHDFGEGFDSIFNERIQDADQMYEALLPVTLTQEEKNVTRQAYAGLLWSKQFYHYVVREWINGDSNQPAVARAHRKNADWSHFYARDVISMPDKWEYPWFAVWDLSFHVLAFCGIDPYFSKEQLLLFLREWYLHPSGALPAYEWDFNSVNPPVHAWACWRVYRVTGSTDRVFLERAFHKLLLNFTWWVNRKDAAGAHIFSGGFLGLDNISIFDRNELTHLEQADATSWMALYCAYMLTISLELAVYNPAMEDIASKFFEHFVAITDAINTFGGSGLWDEEDGFFYDITKTEGQRKPLKIRSVIGLIPLSAMCILEKSKIDKLPGFKKRMEWFMKHKPWLSRHIESSETSYLLAIVNGNKLKRIMKYVADPDEFLSPYGLRSLSRYHLNHPFVLDGYDLDPVSYLPGESDSHMFGGNSNWRGPIWFPVHTLIVEALRKYHRFYCDSFQLEYPTRSGQMCSLLEVAEDLAIRCVNLFLPHSSDNFPDGYEGYDLVEEGMRPCHGKELIYRDDPYFKDLILFYEYFHGDTGKGLGASHQTGWTGLAVVHMHHIGEFIRDYPDKNKTPSLRASSCAPTRKASFLARYL